MTTLFAIAVGILGLYLAYRIIRGGFERPQSERLGCYGIIGIGLLLILLLSWAEPWISSLFF